MCGIFGFYLNRRLDEKDIQLGLNGLKIQNHRGPDNTSYWVNKSEGIFIGHNRLTIIDSSNLSNQPMQEKGTVISFNGEIYNFLDLRRKYKNDFAPYKTNGDTEILLKLWKKLNIESLNEIDGMFAFAVFENSELNLVVDFFGEKPLYFYTNKDGIFFSSEIKPIVKLLDVKLNKSEINETEFKLFGYINSPKTIYQNLKKISPGTYVKIFKRSNKILYKNLSYARRPERAFEKGKIRQITKKNIEQIKDILINSIQNRLVSDVPVGVFMSSGIDSVLISTLIKKELNREIINYTVKFDKKLIHDESLYASKISKTLGLKHEILQCNEKISYNVDMIKDLYSHDLNDNLTILPVNEMCKLAKKSITVALCGMGGDELFLGYNRYSFYYNFFWLIKNLRNFKVFINLFNKLSFKKIRKLNLLYENFLSVPANSVYVNYKNFNQKKLFNEKLVENICSKYFDSDLNNFITNVLNYDLSYTMPNSYIPAMELGSMKNSLEVRSPFLNRKLLNYIENNIDQRSLIKFGKKNILKKILSEYLPQNLYDTKKKGFIFPIEKILSDSKKESRNYNLVKLRKEIYNNI